MAVKELDLFEDLLKGDDNEWIDAFNDISVPEKYITSGSLSLDALLSGTIFGGGTPDNTITAFAGMPSAGKTYYAVNIVKLFLDSDPRARVAYFESENAITLKMLQNRGVDIKRCMLIPVSTVQEFRTQILKRINKYLEIKEENRIPLLFVLDSLGNLSTEKEMNDIAEGKDTRDMTRAQLIRGAFRVISLKLGKAHIPMIITNHVYDVIGSYYPIKKMNGGSGLEYAASQIIYLDKKQDKEEVDGKKVTTGVIISAILKKGRHTIENKKVETYLNYRTGLDPYYGLLDLALKFEIFKKMSTRVELTDGTTEFASRIESNPEKYFTKEVLEKIDIACKDEFLYGKTNVAAAPTGPTKKEGE